MGVRGGATGGGGGGYSISGRSGSRLAAAWGVPFHLALEINNLTHTSSQQPFWPPTLPAASAQLSGVCMP